MCDVGLYVEYGNVKMDNSYSRTLLSVEVNSNRAVREIVVNEGMSAVDATEKADRNICGSSRDIILKVLQ